MSIFKALIVIWLSACLCISIQAAEDLDKEAELSTLKNSDEAIQRAVNDKEGIRLKAVYNAGLSYATQKGMYWRHQQIQKLLESGKQSWYTIIDFNKFIFEGNILAPVMQKSERMYEQVHSKMARTVNASYTLRKDARIVMQPPTWRDYLFHDVQKPVAPNHLIMPRNSDEQDAWDAAIEKGFELGIEQANLIFEYDTAKLKGDIEGMYLFLELHEQGVVTKPRLSKTLTPLLQTADGRTLNINDTVYEIQQDSRFARTNNWKPRFTQAPIKANEGGSNE